MSYILLQTSMVGSNPQVVATSVDANGKLAAFGNYCSSNNIGIVNWSYRDVKDTVGIYAASQMDDETNYNLFQVYQLADWEGDPAQNFWVNDIAMFRWLYTGVMFKAELKSLTLPEPPDLEERKDSTTDWDDVPIE